MNLIKQIASSNSGAIESTKYFKSAIWMGSAEILGLDKRAGVTVSQVDDVNASCFTCWHLSEWVVRIADEYFHGWRGSEKSVAARPGLGEQFGHAILRPDGWYCERFG